MRRAVFAAVTQLVPVNQRSISRTAESRNQDQFHTGPQNGQPPDPDHGTKKEKQAQRQQTQQQGSRIAEHIRQGTEQPAGFFALRSDFRRSGTGQHRQQHRPWHEGPEPAQAEIGKTGKSGRNLCRPGNASRRQAKDRGASHRNAVEKP